MMELNINCIDGWPQITNEYVYFAVLASNVLQFQDGSKAAVAAGNARNKMDGINSEQEEVLVVVTSSSVVLYLLTVGWPLENIFDCALNR